MLYGNHSHDHSPSAFQAHAAAAAGGFVYRPHSTDLTGFLSAAVGHRQILHEGINLDIDDSDDDDEISGPSDDEDEENRDDEQSDGDASSGGELDE